MARFTTQYLRIAGLAGSLWVGCGARTSLDISEASSGTGTACLEPQTICGGACCDGICLAGICQPVVSAGSCARSNLGVTIGFVQSLPPELQLDAQNIAVQGGYVYYISMGHLARVPVLGGPEEIVSTEPLIPSESSTSLIAGPDSVFYEGAAGVFRVANGVTTLVAPSTNGALGRRLAATASDLVIVRESPPGTFTISKMPSGGGSETSLYTYQGGFTTVTADSESVYVASPAGIYALPLSGAPPTTRSSRAVFGGPWSLAVDGGILYTSFQNSASVFDVNLGAIDASASFMSFTPASSVNIQVDAQRLFVLGGFVQNGELRRSIFTLKKGGPGAQNQPVRVIGVNEVATDAANFPYLPSALAIDDQQIFFLDHCDDTSGNPFFALVTVGKDYVAPDP